MQPGKRKLSAANSRSVRVRQPAYFLPELAHVVAAADERVPFVNLAQEVCNFFKLKKQLNIALFDVSHVSFVVDNTLFISFYDLNSC